MIKLFIIGFGIGWLLRGLLALARQDCDEERIKELEQRLRIELSSTVTNVPTVNLYQTKDL